MSISVAAPIQALLRLTAAPSPFLWLLEIAGPDGGPLALPGGAAAVARITSAAVKVAHNTDEEGEVYDWLPWSFELGPIASRSDGSIDGVSVKLALDGARIPGAFGLLPAVFELNRGFSRCRARLILVHADHLGDPGASVAFRLRVTDSSIGFSGVQLSCSAQPLNRVRLPSDIITRECRWPYRSVQCGFTGDPNNLLGVNCPKTLAACGLRGDWEEDNGQERLHPKRFGGFPALPPGSFSVT